jgi:hypothetical protein
MLGRRPCSSPIDNSDHICAKGLCFRKNRHLNLEAYCDVDWATSRDDRRSIFGYYVFVGGNLVSWRSKKQVVVTKSTADAEYRLMVLSVCELIG